MVDKDEVKVILDLYKAKQIDMNQALNLLGYNSSKVHDRDPIEPVQWPARVVKPIKKEHYDGSC